VRTIVITEELAEKLWTLHARLHEQDRQVRYAIADLKAARDHEEDERQRALLLRRSLDRLLLEIRDIYSVSIIDGIELGDRSERTVYVGASDADVTTEEQR